jgi:cytochrome c oxidase assembly protein Cox11
MPVRFYVGDDLPNEIRTLTLSYTLYPAAPVQTVSSSAKPGGDES